LSLSFVPHRGKLDKYFIKDSVVALGQIALSSSSDQDRGTRARLASLSQRYGIALVCVAAALSLSLPLKNLFPYPFLFLFFAAVMASAWLGGTGPGIFAVILSTLAVDYYFVPPLHSLAINATDTAYFVAFIVSALAASWVSSSKKKSEEALREARDHLEARVAERTAELQKMIAELQENERQREQLVTEKSVLSGQLEARKIVERAKGILQREMKISEEEAYRAIQKQSQQMRKSMKEISETIILNDELKRGSH
jgi:K+-sensing histidine kinase KdpD